MLTDTKLKNLKPAEKAYKVPDRDGMYATVLPSGTISFRYNYRVNGRYETLVLGRYGAGGLSLQEARERLQGAKKAQSEGKSPSRLKAQSRSQLAAGEPFSVWAERWLLKCKMAESTRDMRRAVYERDLKRPFGSLLLHEITHNELRSVCDAILARGAPATAVHARDIVKLVFKYACYKTPSAKDYGVDIVAIEGSAGILVQAKTCGTDGARLGWDAVKEVVAGEAFYKRRHFEVQFQKVCITNQFFNSHAIENAALNGVKLLDQTDLAAMLNAHTVTMLEIERMLYATWEQI